MPMATDIAFALGILALFGSRAPIGLKVFLTALAIADDMLAVLVIAVFYTDTLVVTGLVVSGICLLLILLAARSRILSVWVYYLLALGAWAGVLVSGVHATVAGVLIALCVPVQAVIEPREFLDRARRRIRELDHPGLTRESMVHDHGQMAALDDLYHAVDDMRPPGLALEHQLHPVQAFLILPLFALFSAGVTLDAESFAGLSSSISLGIILGLVLGKQVGILGACWLALRSGRCDMPRGVGWAQLWGVSCLAGIGFTMSIFICELAFLSESVIAQAKLGILVASLLAGIIGFVVLGRVLPRAERS